VEGQSRAHLIDLIFSGIEETPPWGSLLKQLRAELSLSYAAIVMRHSRNIPRDGFTSDDSDWDIKAWWEQTFSAHFRQSNIFVDMNLAPGKVATLKAIRESDQGPQWHAFRECLRSAGMDDLLYVKIGSYNEYGAHLYLSRHEAMGAFTAAEMRFCEALAPYLERSLRLYSLIMSGAVKRDVAQHALSHLGIGSLLMDREGTIFSVDSLARDVVAANRHLTISGNRFRIHDADLAAKFRDTCDALLATGCRDTARALCIKGGDGDYVQMLVRRVEHDYGQSTRRYLLVLVNDPSLKTFEPALKVVSELFDLTRREAMIAIHLAQGFAPAEIADALGLQLGTVRTHLKSIFSKTGKARQADLVRAISMSLALFATDNDLRPGTAYAI
jgi:DNA-binding CsgD family transcriptional regulator